MNYATTNIIEKKVIEAEKNYSRILDEYQVEYKRDGNYLQVGTVDWVQGWIIELSVIVQQFPDLITKIFPLLLYEKTSFKMARNAKTAGILASGELGYLLLGKLITIYPRDENQANHLARELIRLTSSFRGPQILTNRHLGSIVYTRYGACKPVIRIDERGKEEKCIYDPMGVLIRDPYNIPFALPDGITWPYADIAPAIAPKLESVLQDKYKPMGFLKEDFKGSVRKGLYLQKWWHIRWCVIKEGRQNMIADAEGRDAADRLRWQFELHKNLEGILPLPVIFDLFTENGDTYLVMEYIRGASLDSTIARTFKDRGWKELLQADRLKLINYAGQVLEIIGLMHSKGYLHRDITPMNFLVGKKGQLKMIDLELSYSEKMQKPFPAFRLGTPGFMSPEQEANTTPTAKQDIYALGALLINLLTALSPGKFATGDQSVLEEQLNYFIPDQHLVQLLSRCLLTDPLTRPALSEIQEALEKFRIRQSGIDPLITDGPVISTPDRQALAKTIQQALQALAGDKMTNSDHLWVSKTDQEPGFVYSQTESVSVYPNLFVGLSGVLYVLAKAHEMGFSVQDCKKCISRSLRFIHKNIYQKLLELPGGLYYGTAGVAVALVAGIRGGMIPGDVQILEEVRSYLSQENSQGPGIVKGLTGQGMALLLARSLLGDDLVNPLLRQKVEQLLAQQQTDGSWISLGDDGKTAFKPTGYGHGVAGIILFLLEYNKQVENKDAGPVQEAIIKALGWLIGQAHKTKYETIWYLHDKAKDSSPGLQEGSLGVILCLIKAYDALGNITYRQLAEEALSSYPAFGICKDLTLADGLVGYAETCLEAAIVFKSTEWQQRADWVTQFLLHYFRQNDGSRYWLPDGNTPLAGLLNGNSGIIYFLMRYYQPASLSHPLLFN